MNGLTEFSQTTSFVLHITATPSSYQWIIFLTNQLIAPQNNENHTSRWQTLHINL